VRDKQLPRHYLLPFALLYDATHYFQQETSIHVQKNGLFDPLRLQAYYGMFGKQRK
jgi:hypothetical protein